MPLRTQVRPIAGALEFDRSLVEAGHVVVVAAPGERELVDEALDLVRITNVVRYVVSGDEVSDPKPAPDLVVAALRTVGASHGVLVGDTVHDVKSAARAGVPCIAVLTGGNGAAELTGAGAALVTPSAADLLEAPWSSLLSERQ
ncbi:MAG: HAD hydrolase-like protein [Dermatophilaceae bacterium]